MRWRGRRQSSNVEDRRGRRGMGGGLGGLGGRGVQVGLPRGRRVGGGGLGLGTIVILLIFAWVFGVNPLSFLDGGSSPQFGPETATEAGRSGTPADDGGQFVATVLADTEDIWGQIFSSAGENYPEPTLVLFSGSTSSACGFATAASGPFYCPAESKVYIDLAFYDELRSRFRAPGDFAQAYVIAHEIGHHVQNVLGVLPKVNSMRQRMSETESNQLSVLVELQADCYAGIWAHASERMGIVEDGDIDEALNAAAAVGDDTIQRRTQGYVVPDSFNHGTSEQRARWFRRGYQTGSVDSCNTFEMAEP